MSNPLPMDLWLEIFKRLPVESICKCRHVCKSWYSLLSSRFFITLHHNFTSLNTPTNHKPYFLLNMYHDRRHCIPVYPLYHPQQDLCGHITCLDLPFPVNNICGCLWTIGVIHGIVCIVSGLFTFVWNPTTQKYISLKHRKYAGCYSDFGFGFDSKKNDFKVVRIVFPWYDVFSVDDGVWRESVAADNVKGCKPLSQSSSCFIDGNIYWIAFKRRSIKTGSDTFALLLFDCELEQFKTMELPIHLSQNNPILFQLSAQLCKYADMLSLLKESSNDHNCYELWAMEEENTWNKLFTIEHTFSRAYTVIMLGRDLDPLLPSLKEMSSFDFTADLSRFHQPLNGQIFEESLFLTDVKENKSLQQVKQQQLQDGKDWSLKGKILGNNIVAYNIYVAPGPTMSSQQMACALIAYSANLFHYVPCSG